MWSALLLASALSAWDEFEPPPAARPRLPTGPELSEALDELQRGLARWQREVVEFRHEQRAQVDAVARRRASLRDAPDAAAQALPAAQVEVVRNPGAKAGPARVVEPDAAQARAEASRRRCADDPHACHRVSEQRRRLEAGNAAFEAAIAKKRAELERRERELEARERRLHTQEAGRRARRDEAQRVLDAQERQPGPAEDAPGP